MTNLDHQKGLVICHKVQKKRLKTSEKLGVGQTKLESDVDIFAGSDIDDNDYSIGDSESNSESEEDEVLPPPSTPVLPPSQPSCSVSTSWTTVFSSMRGIPLTGTNELLVPASNKPRYYFDLFLNESYIQKIVDCSNK